MSDPKAERVGRKGAPIAAAWSACASVKFENSTISIGRGFPCSTARRKQYAEPIITFPTHAAMTLRASPAPMI